MVDIVFLQGVFVSSSVAIILHLGQLIKKLDYIIIYACGKAINRLLPLNT